MRTLEDIGEQRFGGGISYTFAVMPSGRVYEGHGVDRQGAHTGGRNDFARAIVLVGDYSSRAPTVAQRRSVAALLIQGKASGWWREARLNGGHRQAPGASTACPGDAAFETIPEINKLAASGVPSEEDDMGAKEMGVLVENQRRIMRAIAIVTETQRRVTVGNAAIQSQLGKLIAGEAKDLTAAQVEQIVTRANTAALNEAGKQFADALAEVDEELEKLSKETQA